MPDIEHKYQGALDYLYGFVDYSLTRQLRYSPEKFNLDRMRALMQLMGNPQRCYPVIHIAGTKGKGSTAAMLANILREAGYKTGLYTSPHLQDFTERFQVNGNPISHSDLVNQVARIQPFVAQVPEITTFEITTAIAFQEFCDQGIDIAVIEVGLGGRLDATNIVDPLVSVITKLSFDHMNVLGKSIEKIATEKAGIIKQGKPVVLAPQWKEAREVIESIAKKRHSPLTIIGRDYLFSSESHTLEAQTFRVWSRNEQELMNNFLQTEEKGNWSPKQFTIPLLGLHQIENAASVYATIQILKTNGWKISDTAVRRGYSSVKWPGRFEILRRDPLIIVDSAHNEDSALHLRLAMDDYLNGRPILLLFGSSEDKDVQGMFSELLPRVKLVIATKSTHPRAMEPDKLVKLANQLGKKAIGTQSVEEGIKIALQHTEKDTVIMIAGSIFVAAAAREIILTN